MNKIHDRKMAGRQRAGQQLSRNSHWILVWSNTGLKGWGVQFTLLSSELYRISIIRGKGLQFLLKGTGTADPSQTCHTHHQTWKKLSVTGHSSTPCLYRLHLITATFLPSAAPHLLWAQCCQLRGLWAVAPSSLAGLWCTSAPQCYLLPADSFQI